MFSQLRKGNYIYILEKGDSHVLKIGVVQDEGKQVPRYTSSQPFGVQTEMVIDVVKVRVGEQEYAFEKLSATKSIEDYGNAVVSDSKEAMWQEIESLRATSTKALDSIAYHEKVLSDTSAMHELLYPKSDEERKRDEEMREIRSRLSDYDGRFDALSETLGDIQKLLSKAAKEK